jgi:hypothetical protein
MTSRTTAILQAANPVDGNAFETAWSDAEGRAALDRILADDSPALAVTPHRTRRRVVLGAAIATAAGAAVAIVGIPDTNHNGTPAAWAVTRNADGTVTVKISDYRDSEGLQRKLREAGLRADVVPLPPSCVPRTRGYVFAAVEGDTFTPPYDPALFISQRSALSGPHALLSTRTYSGLRVPTERASPARHGHHRVSGGRDGRRDRHPASPHGGRLPAVLHVLLQRLTGTYSLNWF